MKDVRKMYEDVKEPVTPYAADRVTVETSLEQALSTPLYALTAKKYCVLGSSPMMVAEGEPTKVD